MIIFHLPGPDKTLDDSVAVRLFVDVEKVTVVEVLITEDVVAVGG